MFAHGWRRRGADVETRKDKATVQGGQVVGLHANVEMTGADYTKLARATVALNRIMAVVHPDCALLAALLCLLLWGAL
jgi:hypothetical protein